MLELGNLLIFCYRKEPARWSDVARSGNETITTTQCEAYELAKVGHEYEDLSVYQNSEYEVSSTKGPHVPTMKSGEWMRMHINYLL